MGASYSCIVTKELTDIPVKIPHFYKNNVLTIPVDCKSRAVESFLKLFDQGKLTDEGNEPVNFEHIEFDHDTKDPASILSVLEKTNLTYKRFLVLYYSEWADIPDDIFYAAFEKGAIVDGTKKTPWDEGKSTVDAFDFLGIEWGDIYRTDYFSDAYWVYRQSLEDR